MAAKGHCYLLSAQQGLLCPHPEMPRSKAAPPFPSYSSPIQCRGSEEAPPKKQ
jgi:hypothetical protein